MVALADESRVVGQERLPGRGSSEALMPAVRRLFAEAGWTVAELDAVAVVDGPGSFTGVRVGLSAAKGLCEAAGVGLVAVSRLALVAGADGIAVLDGGRGEFYCGLYRAGECLAESLIGRERVEELAVGSPRLVTCEARVAEALEGLGVRLPVLVIDEPGAEAVLAMALARIAAAKWSDVAAVDANYLRRTDAELVFERKSAGLA